MDIKEYKCPNCGGAVKFDSSSQKMKCPYCDAEFEIKALEECNFDWGEKKSDEILNENELDDLSTGVCPSCGAELLGDKNTVAMVCPCCGNAQIVSQRLSGFLKPDYLIPFKQDKKFAIEALKRFSKGKRLLPDFFTEDNHINNIQGLYVPFWLFDAKADGHICYKATKEKTRKDSSFVYKETSFYSIVRDGSISFEKIPVDGSEKMDDTYMDAIEPFNYKQLKEFHTSFLAGYIAEKYDVDAEKSKERAETRIEASVEDEFASSIEGYDSVEVESSSINVKGSTPSYALFPVWVLNTKYKEKNYLFMMNGESGKLVGKLPIDSRKIWKYGFIYSGIVSVIFAILCLAAFLLNKEGFMNLNILSAKEILAYTLSLLIFALGIGFGYVWSWRSSMNTAVSPGQANAYMVENSLKFREKKDKFLYNSVSKTKR